MKRSIDLKRLEGQIRHYQPKWRKCKSALRFKLKEQLVYMKPVVSLRRVAARSSGPINMTADMTKGLSPQTSSIVDYTVRRNNSKGRESCNSHDTYKTDDSNCGSSQSEELHSNTYVAEKDASRMSRSLVDTPPEIAKRRRKNAEHSPPLEENPNKINYSHVETMPSTKKTESVTFSPFRIMHRRKSCMDMIAVERTSQITDKTDKKNHRKTGTEPESHSHEPIPPTKVITADTNCVAGSPVEHSPRKLRRKSCADVISPVSYPKKDEHLTMERIESKPVEMPLSKSSKNKKTTNKKEVHFDCGKGAILSETNQTRKICPKKSSLKRRYPKKNSSDSVPPAETTKNQQAALTRNRRKSGAEIEPEKAKAKEIRLEDMPNICGNLRETSAAPTLPKKRSHKKKEVQIDRHTTNGGSLDSSVATVNRDAAEPEKKFNRCNEDTEGFVTIDLCLSSDEDVSYVPAEGVPDKKPKLYNEMTDELKPTKSDAPELKEAAKPPTKRSRGRPPKQVTSKNDANKRLPNERGTIEQKPSGEPPKRKRGRPFNSTKSSKTPIISYVAKIMESSDTEPAVASNGATPVHEPPIKLVLRRTTKRPDLYQSSTKIYRDPRKRRTTRLRMGASGATASVANAAQIPHESRSSPIPMELEPRLDYAFYPQPNGVAGDCATPSTTMSSSTGHVTSTTPFFGAKNGEGYVQPPVADGGGQYMPSETVWNNTMTQPLATNAFEYNNIQDFMSYLDENDALDASGNLITIENFQSESIVTQESTINGQNSIQWIASSTVTQCTETYVGQATTVSSQHLAPSYGQSTTNPLPPYVAPTHNPIQRPHMATSSTKQFAVPPAHHQMAHPYGASASNAVAPSSRYHNLIVGVNRGGAALHEQCEPLDLSHKSEFIRVPTRPAATVSLTTGDQLYTGNQQHHQLQQSNMPQSAKENVCNSIVQTPGPSPLTTVDQRCTGNQKDHQQSNIPQPAKENVCNSIGQTPGPNICRMPVQTTESDDDDCESTSSTSSSNSSSSSSSSGTSDSDSSSTDSSTSSSSESSSVDSSKIRAEVPPVALSSKSDDEEEEGNAPKATEDQVQTLPGEEEEFIDTSKADDSGGTVQSGASNQVITEESLNNETPEEHTVREEENSPGDSSTPSNPSRSVKRISLKEFMMRSAQKMRQKRLLDQDQGPTERHLDEEEFISETVSPLKDIEEGCQPASNQETTSSFEEQRSKTAENSFSGDCNDSQLDYEEYVGSMTQENEDTRESIEQETPEPTESEQMNKEDSNTGVEVSVLLESSARNEVKSTLETKLPDEPLRIIDITDEIEDDQISLATSCFSSSENTSPTKEKQQICQTEPPRVQRQQPRVEVPAPKMIKPEKITPEAKKKPLPQATPSARGNPSPRNNFRKLQLPKNKPPAQPSLPAVRKPSPKDFENIPEREVAPQPPVDDNPPQRNDMLLHMYGLDCWAYLVDYCTEMCPLSHNFCEPLELFSKLQPLSDDDLRSAYNFMYSHERLFRRYFVVFCSQYEQRLDRDMLLVMVSDCLRYVDSGGFIYRIYSGLLRCGLNPVNACRHVLGICSRVTAPRIINTLVEIIMQTDWTMFSDFLLRFASNEPRYRFPYNALITMAKSWIQRQDPQMAAVIFSCMLTLNAVDAMRIRESPLLTRIVEVVST